MNLERQASTGHAIDVGRQLVGVAAVLEREIQLVGARHDRGRLFVLFVKGVHASEREE